MAHLQAFQAKICITAAGILIHQDRVLLVKHKKLGIWLNPGGHTEPDELPHCTAEREFWEETGVEVEAYSPGEIPSDDQSEYLPNPILSNLHWISQQNYDVRTQNAGAKEKNWQRGCEQHLSLLYLVKPKTERVDFRENIEETDGISWFTQAEVRTLETNANIKYEVEYAFQLCHSR